jgi:plastocyanin
MRHRTLAGIAASAVLLIAACSSSGATVAPSQAAPTAEASAAAPSVSAAAGGGGGAVCSQSAATGTVAVAIKDFAFGPADISAKVGDVITFTNGDSASHTATLDNGSCTTGTISPGSSDGLTFTAAGTYPFHCKIHTSMKGTITVS